MNKKVSEKEYCGIYGYCKDCNQPVSHYTCNQDLIEKRKEAYEWDWWASCDNENCKNHYGEGIWQDTPDWQINFK